jgi:hypothetical protein
MLQTDAPSSITARIQAYAGAIAMVAVATLIGLWIAPRWGTAPVDMIYLPAVLAAAAGACPVGSRPGARRPIILLHQPLHTLQMYHVGHRDVDPLIVAGDEPAAGIRSWRSLPPPCGSQ